MREDVTERLELPLFPLGSVLFPAGRLGLRIFEPRYVAMVEACLGSGAPFGVVLIRGGYEVGTPAVPHAVGCTARIQQHQRVEDDSPVRYELVARGESPFRIVERRARDDGLLLATVELLEPPDPVPLPASHAPLAEALAALLAQMGADALPQPLRLDDAAWVACRFAELLPVAPERRQALLEEVAHDPLAALAKVTGWMQEARR